VLTLNLSLISLILFKTLGLMASVLLLIQSIDANNPLIQKLCGDDKKNCNAILSSNAAKVTDYLNWSEVGFFYFAGTWLALLFNTQQIAVIQTLALINLLCLPYTVYSIYYQWRVAKQWCKFCCAVQAILWLEFFSAQPYLNFGLHGMSWSAGFAIISSLVTPILIWMVIKPYLLQAKQLKPLKQQLRKFKYNTDLFQRLLSDEVQYALPKDDASLLVGNRNAKITITMVANPFCQPCAKAHKALAWLHNRDDIKLQVLFSGAINAQDRKTKVAKHLMTLQQKDSRLAEIAMNAWYDEKDKAYEDWAKKYPVEPDNLVEPKLAEQQAWCNLAGVRGTPAIFINGRRFPENYQPEDLKYFI